MNHFLFSCDAHILEPIDLFTAGLSNHLKQWAPNVYVDDKGMRINLLGDNVLFKVPANFHEHKVGEANDLDTRRTGMRDLRKRFADMHRDGVDAELCFPSLGLLISRITDAEASRACCRLYNDWAWDYLEGLRENTLVPTACIPLVNMEDAMAELEHVIEQGYKAIMMAPAGLDSMPTYNDAAWDSFFALCAKNGIPLAFHTGVGNVNIRAIRGAGGALFNYTRQMNDAVDVIAALVGGGILDRNPEAHVLFVECGAGWLMALGERMDEVYHGHAPSIHPKLNRLPSQIVSDQVHCSFQNDPGCLLTRKQLSGENFLFASDYPHSEGTYPFTQKVLSDAWAKYPDVTEEEKALILGGTAAKMFKLDPAKTALETQAYLKAS